MSTTSESSYDQLEHLVTSIPHKDRNLLDYYMQSEIILHRMYADEKKVIQIFSEIDDKVQKAKSAVTQINDVISARWDNMKKMLYDFEILAALVNRYTAFFSYETRYDESALAQRRELFVTQYVDEVISIAKCALAQRQIDWVFPGTATTPYDFRTLEQYPYELRFKDINRAIELLQIKPGTNPKISLPAFIRRHNITRTHVEYVRGQFSPDLPRPAILFDNNQQLAASDESLSTAFIEQNAKGKFELIDEEQLAFMLLFIAAYYNAYFPYNESRIFLENYFSPDPMYIKHGVTAESCKTIIIPNAIFTMMIDILGSHRLLDLNLHRFFVDRIDQAYQWLKNATSQYDQILCPFFDRDIHSTASGHWVVIRLLKQPGDVCWVSILDSMWPQVSSWEAYLKDREIGKMSTAVRFIIENIILKGYKFKFTPQPCVPKQVFDECGVHAALNIAAACFAGKKQVLAPEDFDYDFSLTPGTRYFFAWHWYLQLINSTRERSC